jgi:hypothetical protein
MQRERHPINLGFHFSRSRAGVHQEDEPAFAAPTWPLQLFQAVNTASLS